MSKKFSAKKFSEMVEEAKENQKKPKEKPKYNKKIMIQGGICLALMVFSVLAVMGSMHNAASLDEEYAQNEKTIGNLEKQYKDLDVEVSDMREAASVVLYSCAENGARVATLQNAYGNMSGTYSAYADDWKANKAEIEKYFKPSDKVASTSWYSLGDTDGGFTWQFRTSYSFTEKNINVLWTCVCTTDHLEGIKKGDVIAYVTAKYDVDNGLFFDTEVSRTSMGTRHYQKSNVEDQIDKESIDVSNIEIVVESSGEESVTESSVEEFSAEVTESTVVESSSEIVSDVSIEEPSVVVSSVSEGSDNV